MFKNFIAEYYPTYVVDKQNAALVDLLGLWAERNPEFEDPDKSQYLEKGICLTGNVGTGKTELMIMINNYLRYLQSPYAFLPGVVWKYAEAFSKHGYVAFNNCARDNKYFDELALTDEKTGVPVVEYCQFFGDKILVGEALIRRRYELFKESGLQTHFTSNCPPKELNTIYGTRAFSRLVEMCNFFTLTGGDRRMSIRPKFRTNKNDLKPQSQGITATEIQEVKDGLNARYAQYLITGLVPVYSEFDYDTYRIYEAPIATEKELSDILEELRTLRREQILNQSNDPKTELRYKELRRQYADGAIDPEEKAYLWREARRKAIGIFYAKLKAEGFEKIY